MSLNRLICWCDQGSASRAIDIIIKSRSNVRVDAIDHVERIIYHWHGIGDGDDGSQVISNEDRPVASLPQLIHFRKDSSLALPRPHPHPHLHSPNMIAQSPKESQRILIKLQNPTESPKNPKESPKNLKESQRNPKESQRILEESQRMFTESSKNLQRIPKNLNETPRNPKESSKKLQRIFTESQKIFKES